MPGTIAQGPLPEICQEPCLTMPHSTVSPPSATAVDVRRCSASRGRVKGRVGAALPSHGRSHRFKPCHAHQHKHPPRTPQRRRLPADCQQTTNSGRCNTQSVAPFRSLVDFHTRTTENPARAEVRWDSKPRPPRCSGRGRRGACPVTWNCGIPAVTAHARRRPAVPDAVRTERGPGLPIAPDRSGEESE